MKDNQNNANDQTVANETKISELEERPPILIQICTETTQAKIEKKIADLPEYLQEQFDKKNGNISLSYADNRLTFTGYIYGDSENLRALLTEFNEFRSPDCVKNISFVGESNNYFRWCKTRGCGDGNYTDKCQLVLPTINTSPLKKQKSAYFDYIYPKGNYAVLEFMELSETIHTARQEGILFHFLIKYKCRILWAAQGA